MAASSDPRNTLEVTVPPIFGQDQSFSFTFCPAHPGPVVSMVLYFFFRALLTVYTDRKNHHGATTDHPSEPLTWPCSYTHPALSNWTALDPLPCLGWGLSD